MNLSRIFYSYNQIIMLVYFSLCLFFCSYAHKREGFVWRVLISYIAVYFLAVPLNYIPSMGVFSMILKYVGIFIYGIIATYVCYQITWSEAVFIALISYTTRHSIYLVDECVCMIISDIDPQIKLNSYIRRYLFTFVLYVFFSPLLIYEKQYVKKNKFTTIAFKKTLILTVLGVMTNIIFNYFSLAYFKKMDMQVKYTMNVFNLVIGILVIIFAMSLINQEKMETEMAVMKQLDYERRKQYEQSKENIELINIKCHDLRHQIRLLKGEEKIDSNELDSIEKQIRIYDTKVKTGNDALDTLLSEKSLICAKQHIVFNCIIDGKLLSFMENAELYSLFGNILDNAIQSTLEIQDENKRIITLKVIESSGGVFVYQENPYEGEIRILHGLPVTRQNKDYHGYGMKSIKRIADKYSGVLRILTDHQMFRIEIFFLEAVKA